METSNSTLKVISLNNSSCNLIALLDTGSPVSFISPYAFKTFFHSSDIKTNKSLITYRSLSGDPIPIVGTITSEIQLETLPNFIGNINLLISENKLLSVDLIIGCDFINNHNIEIHYYPSINNQNSKVQLFNEIAFAEVMNVFSIQDNKIIPSIKTDFGLKIDLEVTNLIEKINNTNVEMINDNYSVKVALKDHSIYAYSPRPFAYKERLMIREIIDDLLSRNIIKQSTSSYCARIVLVRK